MSKGSNINFEEFKNGFVLPRGYSWDAKLLNGKKEGTVTVKNELGIVCYILNFHNDKLNGDCFFYENGFLQRKVCYCDDIEEGYSYEYKNGKIIKMSYYSQGSAVLSVKEFDGNKMKEYDSNGGVIYEGGYCVKEATYYRNGEGTEYLDGNCLYKGFWKNGKREGEGVSLKNGLADYSGFWKNGVPEGEGVLLENGIVQYEGEWKNGQLKVGEDEWFDYVRGCIVDKNNVVSNGNEDDTLERREEIVKEKENALRMKEVELVKEKKRVEDKNNELLKEIERLKREKSEIDKERRRIEESESRLRNMTGNSTVNVRNSSDWNHISGTVNVLIIDAGVCNDMTCDISLCGYEYLREVRVEKNSLKNVSSLSIRNNPMLEVIETGDGFMKDETVYEGVLVNTKRVVVESELE